MKKKQKKKSSATPKKAARTAATGAAKKVKIKTKKGTSAKPKKTKPSAGKKASKSPSSAATKGKPTADTITQPICVANFTASNHSQICFTGIPSTGCTLFQISGDTYPFSPVTGTQNGLDYTNLTPANNCVTVVVPAINQTYPYNVTCCPGPNDDPTHSVTVNT